MDITRSEIVALCRQGDVIAVEYLKHDLTSNAISLFEGGSATHALCCLGGLDIVEASITGVIESNLHNYLRGNCRLTIRCADPVPTPMEAKRAADFWLARVNDPYDWGMIFGSVPVLLSHRLLSLFSQKLGAWALQHVPNILGSSNLSTCAELAARGVREFNLIAFRVYSMENVDPEILRTDSSLTTKIVLDAPVLID